LKLGLLTTSFPRSEHDPSGAFVLGFARALESRGHEIEVLAPEPSDPVPAPRYGSVSVEWVPYLRPRVLERTFYGGGVPDNLARDPRAWLGLAPFSMQLARIARERSRGWDAIISHWALPSALAATVARRDQPHLAVFHSADLHLLERLPLRRALARSIAAGATSMLFVSPLHRERFLSLLPPLVRSHAAGRAHVCPMGVPPPAALEEPRRDLRRRLGFDRFTVLSLGRLVPIKGLPDAIRAISRVQKSTLVIAGDGPERSALERLAKRSDADVRFTGILGGEDKAAHLRAADAFVHPSRSAQSGREEGVPTALIEAMTFGLPVVASHTGGIPTLVTDQESGLLTPPSDPEALGRALARLAEDRNLRRRLGRRATKVGALYTWPELAPNLEALLG
jgi:glycosyltransferase involved in cell wall biosynthesis